MTALLTCGQTRSALAAVRSLGRAGVAVAVAAPRRPALAMWSKFTTSTFLLPNPATDVSLFATQTAEQAHGRGAEVVLAGTNAAVWALSRWRDELPEMARRVLPPHDALVRAIDRTALHDLAASLGIPSLLTLRVDSPRAVEPALREARKLGMPALVRPIIPLVEREEGTKRGREGIVVANIAQLRRLLYSRSDLVEMGCLIEPRPPGQTVGYAAVCERGRPLVEVFQERLRERRTLSGISTLARTVEPDPEVRRLGRALLGALSWQGPAMIEFLRTEAEGALRLVSVVGRLWSSVALAIEAGVDVPLLLYHLARGEPLPEGRVARPGVRFRWLLGDLQQGITRAMGASDAAEGGVALLRRTRAAAQVLDPRLLKGTATDVFDADDPMPFVYEMQGWVQQFRR